MLGLPLIPCHEFPTNAPAAFFSVHALKDANLVAKLIAFIASGKPVLITDGLAQQLAGKINLGRPNVHVLAVKGAPKSLLELPQNDLDALRPALLRPLHLSFKAPGRVGFYPFQDGSWVIENFNDQPVTVEIGGTTQTVAARGWLCHWNHP